MSAEATKFTTIITLDDHPMIRKGITSVIEAIDAEIEVVECGKLNDCSDLIDLYEPSLIIADLNLPDSMGIDSVKTLAKITDIPILVYSLKAEELVGPSCYKHGAKAFVMKDSSPTDLENAITALLNGDTWCSPTLAVKLMSEKKSHGTLGVEKLSDREIEIFEDLGTGTSIKEIASKLKLSPKTIESHRDRIKTKLGIKNSNSLLITAKDWLTG